VDAVASAAAAALAAACAVGVGTGARAGAAVDEKSTDTDTVSRKLTIVKTETGSWFDTYKRELIDLKRQAEWIREVSPDPQMKKLVWNEEIFPGVGCVDIPAGETESGLYIRRKIYAYFDTCDSHEIIRSEQLGLDCGNGEVLTAAGGQCMMTPEEEEKYYPNLDLLINLCFKSNAGLDDIKTEFGKREMWNYSSSLDINPDMKKVHIERNLLSNRMTLHEIKVMVNDFNIKLLGNHIFIDVDTGKEGEYIGYGWKDTRKLPNGWQKKLNVEKNKFFYWNENVYDISGEKAVVVSTWGNPLNKDNKISPSLHFSDAQYESIMNRKTRSVAL